jgi:hypothetical protein
MMQHTLSRFRIHTLPTALTPRIKNLDLLSALHLGFFGELFHLLKSYYPTFVELRDRILGGIWLFALSTLSRIPFFHPLPEVVQYMDVLMSEDLQCPAHSWSTEDTELFGVVDDYTVFSAYAHVLHCLCEDLGRREHVRIWRVRVLDCIEIEEACMWNALFEEGLVSISSVVWEKPRSAQWDYARRGGQLAVDVLLQSGVKLGRGNKVGVESELRRHCAPATN